MGFDGVCTYCATPSTLIEHSTPASNLATPHATFFMAITTLQQIPVVWVSQPQGIQTTPSGIPGTSSLTKQRRILGGVTS